MGRFPVVYAVDAATFAGLSADDFPDGQRVSVTDDGEKEYEARGADGARSWVALHTGHVTDHEAASDPHPTYLTQAEADVLYSPDSTNYEVLLDGDSQPVDNGEGDWIYVEVTYG